MIRSDGGLVFATTCHESGCVLRRPIVQEFLIDFGILLPEWDDYPELGLHGLDGVVENGLIILQFLDFLVNFLIEKKHIKRIVNEAKFVGFFGVVLGSLDLHPGCPKRIGDSLSDGRFLVAGEKNRPFRRGR